MPSSSTDSSHPVSGKQTLPLTLYCVANQHRVNCVLQKADSDMVCGISHDKITEVEADGLPESLSECHTNNALVLPCAHVFHSSLLALHFLVNDMRCPVCRAGSTSKMSVLCLPEHVRSVFENKSRDMTHNETHQGLTQEVISVSTDRLEMGLQFVASIITPTRICVIPSRLSVTDSVNLNDNSLHEQNYHLHTSFYRLFALKLQEAVSDNVDAQIVFHISHVLFEESIQSGIFSHAQFQNMCTSIFQTRAQLQNSVLSFQGMNCGSLVGSGVGSCKPFTVSLKRNLVRNLISSALVVHFSDYAYVET